MTPNDIQVITNVILIMVGALGVIFVATLWDIHRYYNPVDRPNPFVQRKGVPHDAPLKERIAEFERHYGWDER